MIRFLLGAGDSPLSTVLEPESAGWYSTVDDPGPPEPSLGVIPHRSR
jgi:hypothetical protein